MCKGRLLNEVIDNIELMGDYYQRATLTYTLSENNALLTEIHKYKKNLELTK